METTALAKKDSTSLLLGQGERAGYLANLRCGYGAIAAVNGRYQCRGSTGKYCQPYPRGWLAIRRPPPALPPRNQILPIYALYLRQKPRQRFPCSQRVELLEMVGDGSD